MLADIAQVAADSNFVADIVVASELVVGMAVEDTETVVGTVQWQDMDKYSSFDGF